MAKVENDRQKNNAKKLYNFFELDFNSLFFQMSYELIDGSYYVAKNSTPFCGRFCDEIHWNGETQRRIYGITVMLFQVFKKKLYIFNRI